MASSSNIEKEIRSLNSDKKTLNKRIKEIESILKGLSKDIDDAVDQYNSKVVACASCLSASVSTRYIDDVCERIKDKQEGDSADSSGLQDVVNYIRKERNRCANEVGALEKKISSKQTELQKAKEAEIVVGLAAGLGSSV